MQLKKDLIKNVYNEYTAGMSNADELHFSYTVDYSRYDCGDYITLKIHECAELQGDRPNESNTYYVINVKESRSAYLNDFFLKEEDFKSSIMSEINKQAEQRGIEFSSGKTIDYISDFQKFYLKDSKLHIVFDASSIAANSYGELDFEMPFILENGKFKL